LTADQYIATLEAENRKLRDIINQMMCVAQAVDRLPVAHHLVEVQQRRPVEVAQSRVLS